MNAYDRIRSGGRISCLVCACVCNGGMLDGEAVYVYSCFSLLWLCTFTAMYCICTCMYVRLCQRDRLCLCVCSFALQPFVSPHTCVRQFCVFDFFCTTNVIQSSNNCLFSNIFLQQERMTFGFKVYMYQADYPISFLFFVF